MPHCGTFYVNVCNEEVTISEHYSTNSLNELGKKRSFLATAADFRSENRKLDTLNPKYEFSAFRYDADQILLVALDPFLSGP